MKTKTLLLVIAAAAVLSTSCGVPFTVTIAAPSAWTGKANPLDEPGSRGPTVAELHAKIRSRITGDPVQR